MHSLFSFALFKQVDANVNRDFHVLVLYFYLFAFSNKHVSPFQYTGRFPAHTPKHMCTIVSLFSSALKNKCTSSI